MKNFEDIVKKALGFNAARGDQVSVTNTSFPFLKEEVPLPDSEINANWMDNVKKGFKPLFNVVLIILFFLFAVRPFRKWLSQAGESAAQRALPQGDEVQRLQSPEEEGRTTMENKQQLLNATKDNPDMAADIIKNWIGE